MLSLIHIYKGLYRPGQLRLPAIPDVPGGPVLGRCVLLADFGVRAPVSYTHLDVYKRQLNNLVWDGTERIRFCLRHFLGADADDYTYEAVSYTHLDVYKRQA